MSSLARILRGGLFRRSAGASLFQVRSFYPPSATALEHSSDMMMSQTATVQPAAMQNNKNEALELWGTLRASQSFDLDGRSAQKHKWLVVERGSIDANHHHVQDALRPTTPETPLEHFETEEGKQMQQNGFIVNEEYALVEGAEAELTNEATDRPLEENYTEPSISTTEQERYERIGKYHSMIASWMNRRRPAYAYQIFERALREGFVANDFPLPMSRKLFFALADERLPIQAYEFLQHYEETLALRFPDTLRQPVQEYIRLCDSFRYLHPKKIRNYKIYDMLRKVLSVVLKFSREDQEACIPVLVSALLAQRSVQVGSFTRVLYNHMLQEDFQVPAGFWEHLLTQSKYNRQQDLPFEDVLERSIQAGRLPSPVTVSVVLANMYPYHDTHTTLRTLKCIFQMQQESIRKETLDKRNYAVSLTTLELIGAAAAQKGFYDTNLAVWDMMDLLGYEPSEAIFENTVLAFCFRPDTYENAFACLGEMENRGFSPSRAFVRSMSFRLRQSTRNLHVARRVLQQMKEQGQRASISAYNALLSGAAERGDSETAVSIFDSFAANDLVPNSDSYSFAMEALGRQLRNQFQDGDHVDREVLIASYLDLSDSILSSMEEQGVPFSVHIIRSYVELLCLAGELETATSVVRQAHSQEGSILNNKTVYRVVLAHAQNGDATAARETLQYATGRLQSLERKIAQLESRNEPHDVPETYSMES